MAQELIISISGMRGIIGENLFPATAAEYAAAFGTYLRRAAGEGISVALGRDSRPSGMMLESAVAAGLCSAGVNVIRLGIVTTPCVGVMLRYLKCAGGIVITASHNPIPYNGIKLLLDNGIAPPADKAAMIRQMYFDKDIQYTASIDCGKAEDNSLTDDIHINKVLALCDMDKIASRGYKIVLDAVNGAGGRIGSKLLETLGCEVVGMNLEPTGIFAHTPEPTAENLAGLCEAVRQHKADAGFAQDPDADRLAIVDEKGTYIGEEYTLALAAKYVLSKTPGDVAVNLSTSRMIDTIAAEYGCRVIRTPVGEANVASAMLENGCTIGGEGNGGIIDMRVGPVRDSLVAMAIVLQYAAETGLKISELVAGIKPFVMHKAKITVGKDKLEEMLAKAKQTFAQARVNESDGCRFDLPAGWIHLRASNTEPIVRVIVEAENEETAKKYLDTSLSLSNI
jgi:phosphomannomutase